MGKYHLLTKEEIIDRLKTMEVGEGKELPIKRMVFITVNTDYDPDNFSQEIEDSEETVDWLSEMKKETSKLEFDWVWNNTLGNIKRNSDKWLDNHSKICPAKLHFNLYLSSVTHSNGTRNYYSEENLRQILEFADKNGGIINFG